LPDGLAVLPRLRRINSRRPINDSADQDEARHKTNKRALVLAHRQLSGQAARAGDPGDRHGPASITTTRRNAVKDYPRERGYRMSVVLVVTVSSQPFARRPTDQLGVPLSPVERRSSGSSVPRQTHGEISWPPKVTPLL
jgi:hypothetical protein